MNTVDLMGSIAGTLTTISFLPQVIKTWRSGSAQDISFYMFLLFSVGVFFWLLYGVALNSLPIIITNGITFLLATVILYFKISDMLRRKRLLNAAEERGL